MPIKFEVGDVIQMRKEHPCGNNIFEILRIGADFRIKCTKCQKEIWLPRTTVEKRMKKIISTNNPQ